MAASAHISIPRAPEQPGCGIVSAEANTDAPLKGDFERMARRRYQNPKPFRRGEWWCLLTWEDVFREGRLTRKRKWHKLGPATMLEREARKLASEIVQPMNAGLQTIGSATPFGKYVNETYKPTALPLLATTTQSSYECTLRKHLMPFFENTLLREMTPLTLQKFFSGLGKSALGGDTILKMKETLSSVFASAVLYGLLTKNPMVAIVIPRNKVVNKKKPKPHITPEEFSRLLDLVVKPYGTMIHTAVFSGLRVSELIGLRWEDVEDESLNVDERFCRGDWSVTKTPGSSASVTVDSSVIERIRRLKTLEVELNWGGRGAKKRIKVVSAGGPKDLVFQALRGGGPMNDQNILRRHLRPAAIKLGIDPKKATWRALRTSCATWLDEAGASPKDIQSHLRHSRASTSLDIYVQHSRDSQRRAVAKMMAMVDERAGSIRDGPRLVN